MKNSVQYIIQRYSRYPIHESAEGGYYYEGLEPDDGPGELIIRDTKEEAIEALRKLVEDENALLLEEYGESGDAKDAKDCIEGYIAINANGMAAYTVNHRYIGEGYEYYIESVDSRGIHCKGYVPYS